MGTHRKKRSWFWAWFPAVLIVLWLGIWGSLGSSSPKAAFQRPLGITAQPEHVIHPRPFQAPSVGAAAKDLTVGRGDTLWSIARQQCHDGNDYKNIMKANGLKSWTIKPGQKIRIGC